MTNFSLGPTNALIPDLLFARAVKEGDRVVKLGEVAIERYLKTPFETKMRQLEIRPGEQSIGR